MAAIRSHCYWHDIYMYTHMILDNLEVVNNALEQARLDSIDKFSKHLISEINLAQNGNGFFDKKYWDDYLKTKYAHQNAMNIFYNLLHELSS